MPRWKGHFWAGIFGAEADGRIGGCVGELLLTVLISGFVFGLIGSFIAKNKGIVQSTGFLLGFFLGPIGLIIVALLNPATPQVHVPAQFDSDRDLLSDRYKLWLTQKYSITRNDTLGRYVVGQDSFGDLEAALIHANRLEDIRHEKMLEDADQARLVRKRLLYVAGVCGLLVVLLFAGRALMNHFDRQKAIGVADEAVEARRRELASVLESAGLPLIQSAQMTQANYKEMSSEQIKELGFLTSTVERPRGDLGDSCSIGSGTINWTDYSGQSVWFSSSEPPDQVRQFYVGELEKAGFSKANQFHEKYKVDRIEYADPRKVVFVISSRLDNGSTNAGICVLNRKEMDAALARKVEYDRKMTALQAESDAARRRLERSLGMN